MPISDFDLTKMPLGTLCFGDGFEAAAFLLEGCILPLLAAFVLPDTAHHFLKLFFPPKYGLTLCEASRMMCRRHAQ